MRALTEALITTTLVESYHQYDWTPAHVTWLKGIRLDILENSFSFTLIWNSLQKVIKAQNRQFKLVWHLWTGRLVLQQSLQNNIVQPIHRQHNWAPNCIQCLYILVWKVFEYDYKYHLIDFPDLIIFWNIIEHIPCQHNRAHVIALDTDVSSF